MNCKTLSIVLVVVAAAISIASYQFGRVHASAKVIPNSTDSASSARERSPLVAAPGRVEPLSEEIRVGSELSGKLLEVRVDEGRRIAKGDTLAVLANADYAAQVESGIAQLAEKEAALRKLQNGSRLQEREEAFAAVKQQEAVLENARAEMERHQKLFAAGVTPREDADHYDREYKVAEAQYDAEVQRRALVDDQSREEDIASAQAGVALARSQLAQDRALYEKTIIRAPISGVILRRYHRAGESVTNSSTSPDPIVAIGDEGVLRVRVDVDETDVGRVRLGNRAYVTADAFGDRKFWGHVVQLGGELGVKNVRTNEPTERVDTKILETVVQLDDGHDLPIGLRVDAFILTSDR